MPSATVFFNHTCRSVRENTDVPQQKYSGRIKLGEWRINASYWGLLSGPLLVSVAGARKCRRNSVDCRSSQKATRNRNSPKNPPFFKMYVRYKKLSNHLLLRKIKLFITELVGFCFNNGTGSFSASLGGAMAGVRVARAATGPPQRTN